MTPLKASARATQSWLANSTKAKRVGWVSSPAMRTNFTSPTCLKNSSSWSAVVVYKKNAQNVTERRSRRLESFHGIIERIRIRCLVLCANDPKSTIKSKRKRSRKQGYCRLNKRWRFSGYLRIEIADIHRPADLVDFGRVHVAHDGGLRGDGAQRRVEPEVQWGPCCQRQTQLLNYAESQSLQVNATFWSISLIHSKLRHPESMRKCSYIYKIIR